MGAGCQAVSSNCGSGGFLGGGIAGRPTPLTSPVPSILKNNIKGRLLQKWSDARAQKSCCNEKLKTLWKDFSKLSRISCEEVHIHSENPPILRGREPVAAYQNYTSTPIPNAEEILSLIKEGDEAQREQDEAHKSLSDMGISLP